MTLTLQVTHDAPLAKSSKFDKYEVEERLGQSAYGVVQRVKVRDGWTSKLYALKEIDIHEDRLRDELREALFLNKNRASLKYESVVEYFDVWFNKEKPCVYIMMEYCEHGSLSQYISRCEKLPAEERVTLWGLHIAEAIRVSCCLLNLLSVAQKFPSETLQLCQIFLFNERLIYV